MNVLTLIDQLILNAIVVSTRDLIWDLLSDSRITLLEFKSDICTFAHTVTWETLWPKYKTAQFFLWNFRKVAVLFLQYWPVYIDKLLGQTLIPQTIPKVNSWNSEYPSQIDPPSIPHCTIQRDAIFALSLTQPWLLQRDESRLLQEHPWPLIGQCK